MDAHQSGDAVPSRTVVTDEQFTATRGEPCSRIGVDTVDLLDQEQVLDCLGRSAASRSYRTSAEATTTSPPNKRPSAAGRRVYRARVDDLRADSSGSLGRTN